MNMGPERINNPKIVSAEGIRKSLASGSHVVVQFNQASSYSARLLGQLNDICQISSDTLEVRFYGHYREAFDAGVLKYLPNVKNLTIDSLDEIYNENAIYYLQNLSHLSFGVLEFDKPEFLEALDLKHLKSLSLAENRKRNFDLKSLSNCSALESFSVDGHSQGIEAIAHLPKLSRVILRYLSKNQNISFLNTVPELKALTLSLGGRENISEFTGRALQTLQVLRVQGLQSIGDLKRLPMLRNLRIEDQIKLEDLNLIGSQLERLHIANCKSLKNITGLEQQVRLREFKLSKAAIDLNYFKHFAWPEAMENIQLLSGSSKWNKATAETLKEQGYRQEFQYWN